MMPCEFSKPAGSITPPTDAETLERMCTGFQSISAAFLIACAANFGVVMLMKTSAPDGLQLDDVLVDRRWHVEDLPPGYRFRLHGKHTRSRSIQPTARS